MRSMNYRRAAAGAFALAMLFALAPEASAKITCRDGFQLKREGHISTPYCNDEHLAELARARGSRVTGAELRGNPQPQGGNLRLHGSGRPGGELLQSERQRQFGKIVRLPVRLPLVKTALSA